MAETKTKKPRFNLQPQKAHKKGNREWGKETFKIMMAKKYKERIN